MKRRAFLGTAALALGRAAAAAPRRRGITTRIRRLNLKHTWTTVMSSSDFRDTFYVRVHARRRHRHRRRRAHRPLQGERADGAEGD